MVRGHLAQIMLAPRPIQSTKARHEQEERYETSWGQACPHETATTVELRAVPERPKRVLSDRNRLALLAQERC